MAIHLDVYTRLRDQDIRRDANKIEREFSQAGGRAGRAFGENMSGGIERSAPKVERASARMEKATDKVADSMGRVRTEQAKYDKLVADGESDRAKMIAQSEKLAKAKRAESAAIREAGRVHRDTDRSLLDMTRSADKATGSFVEMGSTMGSLGRVGGGVGIAALVPAITGLAGAAAAASGAIGVLPGVLGAAATAFGTLKIATLGFGDAMENMRDPEKFADALRSLSPHARSAALSIQSLLPAFDQLKNATQDALFAGVGQQLEALADQFLPTIQAMTTSIAGSFNDMFSGVTAQLMTPETSAQIQGIVDNISAAFQNLAPAAGSLTAAFAELTNVGSSFLPGLARAAADAAASFSQFITEANKSGQLEQWINTGLDVMRQLGEATMNVLEAFLGMAPIGEQIMPMIVDATKYLADTMPTISAVVAEISPFFALWAPALKAAAIQVDVLKAAFSPLATMVEKIADAIAYIRGEDGAPKGGAVVGSGRGGAVVDRPGWNFGARGIPGGAPMPGGVGGSIGSGYGEPVTRSGVPIGGGSGAAGPRLPDAPVLPYETGGLPPWMGPQTASTFGAESSFLDAQHKLAEKKARLAQLEQTNAATADDIQKARNEVIEAERDMQAADMRLTDARQSAAEQGMKQLDKLSKDFGQVGAQLDADFGISKGLAGIAENITKFVANLAAAPLLGQLNAVSAANPTQGGHGLMGVMGAQGAFGSQYQNNQYAQQGYAGQASVMGPAPVGGYGSGYPGDAALLSNVPAGQYTQANRGDLTEGLADCSSAVEDLVNLMDGRPTAGASMYTGNAAEWLQSRGFQPGMGGPGDMRVGYNSSHMQATLPGGTPFNWGGAASAARGGVGGTGADDPAFTSHYYRPAGASAAPAAPTTPMPGGSAWGPSTAPTGPAPGPTSLAGVPAMAGGGMPGMGMPQAAPFGQKQYGGITPVGGTGKGGIALSGGGAAGMAMQAGGMALDMMMPGAGQAAQTSVKLINRAIEFGGQAAGIGVQGALNTVLPIGGSELANNSWLTKIVGGIAGAAPALPNVAGKSSQPTPEQVAGQPAAPQPGAGGGGASRDTNITVNNNRPTEDGTGRDIAWHQEQAHRGPGM